MNKYSCGKIAPTRKRLLVVLSPLMALSIVLGSGCSSSMEEAAQSAPVQSTPVMQVVKNELNEDGVRLTTALDSQVAQVAQPINLEITAHAPEGVKVQFPESSASLGPLKIVDVHDQLDIPAGKNRVWKREYKLESLGSGKKTIPSIKVSYIDRRQDKPIRSAVLSTPIELEIASLLEGQTDPTQFRDIKGAVEIPREKMASSWIIYGIFATGTFLLVGFLLLLWHRYHRKSTPAERALLRLAELEQRELLAAGETHIFYCCLTDVIRHYIEDRFGYHAPKQTTTEFLSAVQRENLLCEEHHAPLQEFLQVADMVKFACHSPSRVEADDAIGKAREFIHSTANDEADSVKEKVAA
jgi:hypothetical protein